MKLIYVAGPYSGNGTYSNIEDNIRHAEQVSLKLLQKGWAVITPHKNTAHYEFWEDFIGYDHKKWLDMSLEILKRCDAIIVLKGYELSKGTLEEIKFAKEHKILLFYEVNGIPDLPRESCVWYNPATGHCCNQKFKGMVGYTCDFVCKDEYEEGTYKSDAQ